MKWLCVNMITSYRLGAAPFVTYYIATDRWIIPAILLIGGFVSDIADGWLTRRWDVASHWGKKFDVFCDRVLIVSPMVGMYIAGDFGDSTVAACLLPAWIMFMFSIGYLVPDKVDFANGVLWGISYVLTGFTAFFFLPVAGAVVFVVSAAVLMAIGAATHTELVKRGFRQGSVISRS